MDVCDLMVYGLLGVWGWVFGGWSLDSWRTWLFMSHKEQEHCATMVMFGGSATVIMLLLLVK